MIDTNNIKSVEVLTALSCDTGKPIHRVIVHTKDNRCIVDSDFADYCDAREHARQIATAELQAQIVRTGV